MRAPAPGTPAGRRPAASPPRAAAADSSASARAARAGRGLSATAGATASEPPPSVRAGELVVRLAYPLRPEVRRGGRQPAHVQVEGRDHPAARPPRRSGSTPGSRRGRRRRSRPSPGTRPGGRRRSRACRARRRGRSGCARCPTRHAMGAARSGSGGRRPRRWRAAPSIRRSASSRSARRRRRRRHARARLAHALTTPLTFPEANRRSGCGRRCAPSGPPSRVLREPGRVGAVHNHHVVHAGGSQRRYAVSSSSPSSRHRSGSTYERGARRQAPPSAGGRRDERPGVPGRRSGGGRTRPRAR